MSRRTFRPNLSGPIQSGTFLLIAFAGLCWSTAVRAEPLSIPASVQQAEARRIETMKQCAPAVVAIFGSDGGGGGSGVLIESSGFAVTNFHVVEGAGAFMKCGLNDGKLYDAVLVGIDPTGDVALIQLLGRNDFPVAKVGDSDEVRAGDMVFAMGNPFLLAMDFRPTVTYGMVSGVHRYQEPAGTFLEYTDCLQVDASINPGNSGGPLFNMDGELIGINGRISVEKRGRVNVGAGYAISINQVMHFLDHLKSGRIVDHATLGATVAGTADGSVVIAGILENSSAFRRGLRWGDEVLSFAGRPIRSVNQFKNILGIYPKGWTVPISYRREGKRYDVNVRLMGLHRRAELFGEEEKPTDRRQDPKRPPKDPEEESPESPDEKPPSKPGKKEAGPAPPEQYKHLYIERMEYANYYFNQVAQERLLKHVPQISNLPAEQNRWQLAGTLKETTPIDIRLVPDAVAAKIGDAFMVQKLDEDFRDLPPGTGGLLGALEQLRHFLTDRDDYFTELYYLGSEPLPGIPEKVDVLVTTRGLSSCRWYFRKNSGQENDGQFLGFDFSVEEDADPCEIRFQSWQDFANVKFPSAMNIRSGDTDTGTLQVKSLQITPVEAATSASSPVPSEGTRP